MQPSLGNHQLVSIGMSSRAPHTKRPISWIIYIIIFSLSCWIFRFCQFFPIKFVRYSMSLYIASSAGNNSPIECCCPWIVSSTFRRLSSDGHSLCTIFKRIWASRPARGTIRAFFLKCFSFRLSKQPVLQDFQTHNHSVRAPAWAVEIPVFVSILIKYFYCPIHPRTIRSGKEMI